VVEEDARPGKLRRSGARGSTGLREDLYDPAGKSPEATFRAQLARSRLLVRTNLSLHPQGGRPLVARSLLCSAWVLAAAAIVVVGAQEAVGGVLFIAAGMMLGGAVSTGAATNVQLRPPWVLNLVITLVALGWIGLGVTLLA
jgi:hypothetical protein